MKGRSPDVLGIGAQRAGTTWLWHHLRQHPGVWLPEHGKEIHYFDEAGGGSGPDVSDRRRRRRAGRVRRSVSPRTIAWDLRLLYGCRTDDWYRRLFAPAGDRVTADLTPEYLALGEDGVSHAARVAPDARLILMARHPVERLWSAAAYFPALRRRGDDPAALLAALARPYHRAMGDLVGGVRRWRRHYPAERVLVVFAEDVAAAPDATLALVQEFLGLPPRLPQDPGQRINPSGAATLPAWAARGIAGLVGEWYPDLAALGGYAPDWVDSLPALAGAERDRAIPLTRGDGSLRSGTLDRIAPSL